jgi:NTP pyrophosphatase (non-canonical NTP hydrolase)
MDSETIRSLTDEAARFRDERNWKQFHNPKDMAVSLSLEVAELLELMQWKNGEALHSHLVERKREAGEELSDILYWVLLLAHDLDIDLPAAFRRKMAINKIKYPVDKARNSSKKYNELSADGAAEQP